MDFSVKNENLAAELAAMQRVIDRKHTLPAIQYVLARSGGKGILLSATDLDVAMVGTCEIDGSLAAPALLPAARLYEALRLIPPAEVIQLKLRDGHVEIAAEGYDGKFKTMPVAEFPSLPSPPPESLGIAIGAQTLSAMVRQTHYAISAEGKAPPGFFINGAQLVAKGGRAVMTATDSHRLARAEAPVDAAAEADMILAPKVLRELRAFLAGQADVLIHESDNQIFFQCGDRLLSTRKVDGKYPATDRMIPANELQFEVDRDRLALAIKRVALVTTDTAKSVTFSLTRGALTVSATGEQLGQAADRMVVDHDGEDLEVKFAPDYVLQALDAAAPGKVRLELKNRMSPSLFRGLKDGDTQAFCVVMPIIK